MSWLLFLLVLPQICPAIILVLGYATAKKHEVAGGLAAIAFVAGASMVLAMLVVTQEGLSRAIVKARAMVSRWSRMANIR